MYLARPQHRRATAGFPALQFGEATEQQAIRSPCCFLMQIGLSLRNENSLQTAARMPSSWRSVSLSLEQAKQRAIAEIEEMPESRRPSWSGVPLRAKKPP